MLSAQLTTGLLQAGLSRFDKFAQYYFDSHLKGQSKALSILLAEFWARQQADSAYPIVKPSNGTRIISGKVFDANNKDPLAYVNVGIPGKNRGTVTQQDGSFVLAIDKEMDQDSIQLSMAGYRGETIPVDRLLKTGQPLSVFLNEKIKIGRAHV